MLHFGNGANIQRSVVPAKLGSCISLGLGRRRHLNHTMSLYRVPTMATYKLGVPPSVFGNTCGIEAVAPRQQRRAKIHPGPNHSHYSCSIKPCSSSRLPFVCLRLVFRHSAKRLYLLFSPLLPVVGLFSPLFLFLCLPCVYLQTIIPS